MTGIAPVDADVDVRPSPRRSGGVPRRTHGGVRSSVAEVAESSPRGVIPRRVLYLWDADYPWDVRVEKICRAMTDAGHDVHIVARNRKRHVARERLREGTVHRMPAWPHLARLDDVLGFPAFFNPRWRNHLAQTVRSVRPDVIIARDLPLCPTAIGVGREAGIPVIHDMAEHYPAMIREIYNAGRQRPLDYVVRNPRVVDAVERYCIRHADRILVVIEEMRDRLAALGVPHARIDVVSNTPPLARAAAPRARTAVARPLRLVYLGIMEIPRGIDVLLEAAAMLADTAERIHVDLIGTGRDAALLERRARALGVHGSAVRFHGHVASHDEALRIIAEADIGVLPHRRCEHWDHTIPNKIFDYMAAGLPVLTSDAAPFARVVRETGCGEVFESGDAAALVHAINALRALEVRERYGANGRRAVVERYHWERDAAVLLDSVERAVRDAGARP